MFCKSIVRSQDIDDLTGGGAAGEQYKTAMQNQVAPAPLTVRASTGRLSALYSVSHHKSVLYAAFV
jgi:hypothetical protein